MEVLVVDEEVVPLPAVVEEDVAPLPAGVDAVEVAEEMDEEVLLLLAVTPAPAGGM